MFAFNSYFPGYSPNLLLRSQLPKLPDPSPLVSLPNYSSTSTNASILHPAPSNYDQFRPLGPLSATAGFQATAPAYWPQATMPNTRYKWSQNACNCLFLVHICVIRFRLRQSVTHQSMICLRWRQKRKRSCQNCEVLV